MWYIIKNCVLWPFSLFLTWWLFINLKILETINLTANNNKTLKLKFDKNNKPDKFCTNFNDHFPFHFFSYVSYFKKIGIETIENRFFHKSIFRYVQVIGISLNEIERIYSFTFSDLNFLEQLDLNSNKIKQIDKQAFHKLPNLEFIDLSNNKIENIDQDLFRGLVRLKIIKLEKNNLIFSEQIKLKFYFESSIQAFCFKRHSSYFRDREFENLRILDVWKNLNIINF